jgi:molybdate transport system substrate-binding protein
MNKRQFLAFIGAIVVSFLGTIALIVLGQSNTTVIVSTAASLKEVMEEIGTTYKQSNPGVNINYNFGASGALLQQIQQGAPVDIFISAGKKQMDTLEESGQLVTGTRSVLAKNRLVLIVPNGITGVTNFLNLTGNNIKKIAIGEPRSVPAGQYSEQVLQKLGILDQVKGKFVYANNVRQVLAAVESGNVDAGLVYQTDARISDKVKTVVTADEKFHSPIEYPMAVIKRTKNLNAAKSFLQYLSGEQVNKILRKYDFIPIRFS